MRVTLMVTPLLQLFVYGYAFNLDITQIRMAVVDLDRSQESRDLVRRFEGSGYFRLVTHTGDARAVRELLDRGRVKVALQFDPGFADDLRRGRTAVVQLLVDGTDSNTAAVVSGYTARILAAFNGEHATSAPVFPGASLSTAKIARPTPRIALEARSWYNPDLKSRNYFVPAVIATLLFITCLQLTSMAVVREREIGTLEQLLVTPLRPAELILGKTLPFALIGLFDTAVVTAVAVLWFRVPFQGSLALLFGASALFLLSAVGIGLYVSTLGTDPAAGAHGDVLRGPAGDLAVRLHLPHRRHARGRPILDAGQSPPALPGDRPGHLSQGQRRGDALAAHGRVAAHRSDRARLQRAAFPSPAALRTWGAPAAPQAPCARHAPGDPGRSSISLAGLSGARASVTCL